MIKFKIIDNKDGTFGLYKKERYKWSDSPFNPLYWVIGLKHWNYIGWYDSLSLAELDIKKIIKNDVKIKQREISYYYDENGNII